MELHSEYIHRLRAQSDIRIFALRDSVVLSVSGQGEQDNKMLLSCITSSHILLSYITSHLMVKGGDPLSLPGCFPESLIGIRIP